MLYNCHETPSFDLRNKYETLCTVCYENELAKLVPSSNSIHMAYKHSEIWNENCSVTHYGHELFEHNPFLHMEYITHDYSNKKNRIFSIVYYENENFNFVLLSNAKSVLCKHAKQRYKHCKFYNKTSFNYHRFYYFFARSIFQTAIDKLESLSPSKFMKIHDYVVYCFELCITFNFLASYIYNYILTGIRNINNKISNKNIPLVVNEYIDTIYNIKNYFCAGGRHQTVVKGEIVSEYLQASTDTKLLNDKQYFKGKDFEFKRYELLSTASNNISESIVPFFVSKIPLHKIAIYLNITELRDVSDLHNIHVPHKVTKKTMLAYICDHHCTQCDIYAAVFVEKIYKKKIRSKKKKKEINTKDSIPPSKFPPDPPSNKLVETIVEGFCNDTAPNKLIEGGCAVCGQLSPIGDMDLLNETNYDLNIISPGNVGRYERLQESDPITPLKGPILADNCEHICHTCQHYFKKNKIPPESLANSFWIGSTPSPLQNLTFAEKMLISRIRHNKCLVRVSSGRAKMVANVIMFSNPTVKVYRALPPSRRDISEILAFVFQGPIQPTDTDIKRTPMLVRRNAVKDALEWLKLNHIDYEDLLISSENLNDYPLAGVPVNIEYSESDPDSGNKIASAMSVYDNEIEDGTTDGPCPFTVHGLIGPEFENMSMERLKARALQHLSEKGSTLGISHDSKPQSMYDNPQAYPQMFPWLFPYGLGGIGQKCHFAKISEITQKRNLLMYHDKRFQTDFYFPMIAFNHEQLKAGVTGSFLLAKRKMWPNISSRLKTLNRDVLKHISDKLSDGAHFTPNTTEEKKCFQLLNDLDHVGGFVKGSITSKKHMRNEIWSMISQLGAPSWFITLSPADSRHPICLYYADKNIEFKPDLRSANERNLLVAQNPVAAARFFDLIVRMFIKHVLGVGTDHSGLYGETAGYYGTVEQQGRLTLHLHTLLWIRNALSPQEIRDKLMNNDGEFQKNLIQYLEGCQKGEFLTGTMEYVKSKIPINIENRSKGIHTIVGDDLPQFIDKLYQDPTQTLPEKPPEKCEPIEHTNCNKCQTLTHWWLRFYSIVDDVLLRSNVHRCSYSDPENSKFKAKGCLNKDGICKARFPRPIVPETTVNLEDGYINIKKAESMLNTISPCITYLLRCNTDVTSLLSGTSIKAVISYVTDYIAKPALKTYQIFATAYNVFDRNANLDTDDKSRTDDARKLILKVVNALSSKMEIGSPMASMYLLENPDHYTSHKFIPFWWKSYVNDVAKSETSNEGIRQNHDSHKKIEDVFQDREKAFSEISKGNETDYHDIDVKMEDEYREEEKKKSRDNFQCHMDIDAPINFVGGGHSGIQRSVPVEDEKDQNGTENDDQSEDEKQNGDEGWDEDENEDEDELGDDPTDEKLLISQDGCEFVASSKVDDYKFRPEAYNSLSLYDWSRTSVKSRVSRKNKDNTYLNFLPGHGQRNTHMVKLIPSREETFVLNFIGGPLPRYDQGDFEYYCRTMLTLFRPWRNSRDLKDTHQSWADAFASYEFKPQYMKIMNNFNLRYECLDERDDYHAILKRQSKLKENKTSLPFQHQYDNECYLGIHANLEEDYGNQNFLGPNTIKKTQQMIETEIMMKKAGWLGDDEDINMSLNLQEFHPAVYKTGSQWKSLVKQCRERLLKVKKVNYSTMSPQKLGESNLRPSSVKLLLAEYFQHNFQAKKANDRDIISKTCLDFSLNKEQERGFRIIANHASEPYPDQLKMHLGGMGGTGKTQVIKALILMFNERQENHRFIVLAPTGTAAALLNGFTYHSILGIRSSTDKGEEESLRNENSIIKEVQERLEGVDYIFIDEMSMIACHELYSISSQLSKVTNEHNKPFGGKNIIFAGDFAQLPPTNGSPLYSNAISKTQKNFMTKRDQESTIGRILWHQITTVVILTQNMRQTEMTEDDKKFRTALSNMRYAACTEDDLAFLKTLLVNEDKKENLLKDPNFRNASIITSLNTQKDQINESCSLRFSRESGQQLTHFYSIDKLGNTDLRPKKRGSRVSKKVSASVDIPINIQETLWDSSPCSSEHFPGKLSLCLGMPIMIRNNDATELCITKGQEAYVVGWDATDGPKGQNILETLFLELKNPPKTIELPGLPRNVIPMTRTSKKIKCCLPNDYEINIIRQQINVLPNFAMTDYASQGKTRPKNPVNLSHCKNFQSIYTCLSRSSNAAGTLIIQGFNPTKITRGLSGHLRQEFRDLYVLNEITKEIYEGRLNKKYLGILRNPMIHKYQTEIKKNEFYNMHHALELSDGELIVKDKGEDGMVNLDIYNPLANSNKDKKSLKRKISDLCSIDRNTKFDKNPKRVGLYSHNFDTPSPIGLTWDENDYSCAYDSLFTVLHHIWIEDQTKHRAYFENGTQWIQFLHSRFILLSKGSCTFESVRNQLRSQLNNVKPLQYPYGKAYTDIDELVRDFTSSTSYAISLLQCFNCGFSTYEQFTYLQDYTMVGWSSMDREILQNTACIQKYLNYKIIKNNEITVKLCPRCRKYNNNNLNISLYNTRYIYELPSVLIFALAPWIDVNRCLSFDVSNSFKEYTLKGIIYSNRHHFTARLIDKYDNVWYHDGQTTRSYCQMELTLMQAIDIISLKKIGQYEPIMAFYSEK